VLSALSTCLNISMLLSCKLARACVFRDGFGLLLLFNVRLLVLEVSEFTFSFLFNIPLFERWEDEVCERYHLEFRFGKICFPFLKRRY